MCEVWAPRGACEKLMVCQDFRKCSRVGKATQAGVPEQLTQRLRVLWFLKSRNWHRGWSSETFDLQMGEVRDEAQRNTALFPVSLHPAAGRNSISILSYGSCYGCMPDGACSQETKELPQPCDYGSLKVFEHHAILNKNFGRLRWLRTAWIKDWGSIFRWGPYRKEVQLLHSGNTSNDPEDQTQGRQQHSDMSRHLFPSNTVPCQHSDPEPVVCLKDHSQTCSVKSTSVGLLFSLWLYSGTKAADASVSKHDDPRQALRKPVLAFKGTPSFPSTDQAEHTEKLHFIFKRIKNISLLDQGLNAIHDLFGSHLAIVSLPGDPATKNILLCPHRMRKDQNLRLIWLQ